MALTKPRAYQIFDLDYKQSVRVLTDTNIDLSGGAPNIVDTINLQANDRILVKGQGTGSQNGLYKVQTLGTGSNGTWVRTVDGDTTGEIQAGMIVMVTEGNVYKDTQWKLITNDPIVIGVSALVFELNTSTNQISNGNSSITISTLGGNANVTIGGVANVATFTTTGLTANNIATDGNLVVGNNLVVNGNLTYINITDLNIEDPIIGLGRGPNNTPLTANDGKDRGEQLWYYTSSEQSAFIGYDNSAGKLIAATNVSIANEIVTVNAYGNLVIGNLESSSINATGNVTGGNILTGGAISAVGNITGNYLVGNGSQLSSLSASNIVGTVANAAYATNSGSAGTANTANSANSATVAGTVTANAQANITSVGTLTSLSVTGNVTANYFIGNGSQLTGLPEQYGNANVANYLPTYTGNITAATISTTGNISGNYIIGNGSQLTGLPEQYGNANVAAYLPTYTGNISANVISATGNVTGSNFYTPGTISSVGDIFGGNLTVANVLANSLNTTGNIVGNSYYGNGVGLSGLQGANIIGTVANAAYAADAGSAATANTANSATMAGTVTANAQANITSVGILTSLSVSGNITPGNVSGATTVAATNLTGTLTTGAQTNISLVGTLLSLSVLGNVQGGNFRTIGESSATGNVTGGNILTAGFVSATGNVTGNYFIGNGSQLTDISATVSNISNGTSNVGIATANGNIVMNTDGQETVEVSPGELTVYGVFSNPKTINSNVVIGPSINSMLIGPIEVDPDNNIFVPTGSTLNII
jgi:hypothetical protein